MKDEIIKKSFINNKQELEDWFEERYMAPLSFCKEFVDRYNVWCFEEHGFKNGFGSDETLREFLNDLKMLVANEEDITYEIFKKVVDCWYDEGVDAMKYVFN